MRHFGLLAQWLEHRTHNPTVLGSSPGGPTISVLALRGIAVLLVAVMLLAGAVTVDGLLTASKFATNKDDSSAYA